MRGHIEQRSKGSYTIWVELTRDPVTGRRRRQTLTVHGIKKDAERKLAELVQQVDSGGYLRPSKATVGEFLRQWLADYAATHVRPRTLEGYRSRIECHLIPALGEVPLTQLQAADLNKYYSDELARGRKDGKGGGLSARSVLDHHRLLHEALSHAVKWGLIGRNVAQAVDPPRPGKKEMRTLDASGVGRLLEASKNTPYDALFHLAVYTGMRRSELLGLRWKDVDLDMATLSVVQVLHHLKDGRIVYEEPKTAKSRRLIALSPSTVFALRAHWERQSAERILLGTFLASDSLVFSRPDGSPMLPNGVTHAFIKMVRRVGLGNIRFHDLRHTHASLMLRQGIHPKVVSERLGHSSISITLDTYSHVTPGLQEAAAKRFDEALSAGPQQAGTSIR